MLKKSIYTALVALLVGSQSGCIVVEGLCCCVQKCCARHRSNEFHCNDCGDVYWHEWFSDPPACCDPCDCCGNFTGGRHHGPSYGPYAGHSGMLPADDAVFDSAEPEELPPTPAMTQRRRPTVRYVQQRSTRQQHNSQQQQQYTSRPRASRPNTMSMPQGTPRSQGMQPRMTQRQAMQRQTMQRQSMQPQATAEASQDARLFSGQGQPSRPQRTAPSRQDQRGYSRSGQMSQQMPYQDRDLMLQQVQQQAQQRGRGTMRDPDSGEMLPSPGMRIGDAVVVDSKLSESQIVDEGTVSAPARTAGRPRQTSSRISSRVR